MRIAIISDTHDNIANLDKALGFINQNQIEAIIHCGDACSAALLEHLEQKFKGNIYLSLGNCDEDYNIKGLKFKKIKIFGDFGEAKFDKIKIAFAHFPAIAKKLCESQKYDFIFYGHTHKPWIEEIHGKFFANPGNLGCIIYKPSFAMLDCETKKLELKILDKI